MVTYNHVTEVARKECVNYQARRVDSRAILILIATSVRGLRISNIKAPTEVAMGRSISLESPFLS